MKKYDYGISKMGRNEKKKSNFCCSVFGYETSLNIHSHTIHPMFFTYIERSAKFFVKTHHTYLVLSHMVECRYLNKEYDPS